VERKATPAVGGGSRPESGGVEQGEQGRKPYVVCLGMPDASRSSAGQTATSAGCWRSRQARRGAEHVGVNPRALQGRGGAERGEPGRQPNGGGRIAAEPGYPELSPGFP
jgi:hypothetical protein